MSLSEFSVEMALRAGRRSGRVLWGSGSNEGMHGLRRVGRNEGAKRVEKKWQGTAGRGVSS